MILLFTHVTVMLLLYLGIRVYYKLEIQYCHQHSRSKDHRMIDNFLCAIAHHRNMMLNNYSKIPTMSTLTKIK